MRILYVINGFDPGGAEHGLLTLIRTGCFDGHELRVLGFCRGRGELANVIRNTLGDDKFEIVSDSEKLTLWACLVGFVRILVLGVKYRPRKMILSLKQANIVGRLAAIFMPKIQCVSFEHTAEYRARRFNGVYGPLLRLLSFRVDEIWADCQETLNQASEYFTSKQRVGHVVALYLANIDAPHKFSYEIGDTLQLSTAGRLIPGKNILQMIHLVSDIHASGRSVTLDVYGDGPELNTLQTLVESLALKDLVSFHGYKADWLPNVIQTDIFINLSEMEGFCIVVGEAMAAAMPIIAVDVGGIRDYGVDGKNMLKSANADIRHVRTLIEKLHNDKSLREKIGCQARKDILDEYSVNSCKARMVHTLSS